MKARCTLLLSVLLSTPLLFACGGDDPPDQAQPRTSAEPATSAPPATSAQPPTSAEPATSAQPPTSAPPAPPAQRAPPQPASAPADRAMFAPTPATVMRDTELKAEPSLDARTLEQLPVRTPVTIVDRHGGWFAVFHGDTSGWVRLLHVSSQPPGTHGPIPRELEQAARVATGREGGGNIVVTTGTRGLSEEQLRQAEANTDELRRLEEQGVEDDQAERYAARYGLQRRDVAYPPDPQGANR